MENKEEIWNEVRNYPGYEVSNLGRLRSYHRTNSPLNLTREPTLLATEVSQGYARIKMTHKSGRTFQRGIHIVVLETFVGPRPPLCLALHKDDDQSNNTLSNLYWGTEQNNADDRERNGIHLKGCDSPVARFTEEQVIAILKDDRSCREIARDYDCGHTSISGIQRGEHYYNVAPEIPRRKPKRVRRLKDEDVLAIFHDDRKLTEIGNDYGLTKHAISRIKLQKSYKYLTKDHLPDRRG